MNFPIIEKYESMQRSYSRLMEIKDCKKENEVGNTIAVRDAIEDFFNQTYHFKDWLKKMKIFNRVKMLNYLLVLMKLCL